jgi:ribosome-binding protein aMBF1 (putative translation factor)
MATQTSQSPLGTDATTARRRRAERSAEYRAEEARLAPFEQVARMVIGRRIELGVTQEQLAERMETSASTISRIESGQHVTSVTTLERLAGALELKLLIGFETEAGDRELVSVERRGALV